MSEHTDQHLDPHLDLVELADVLAGLPEPAHVAGCARCRAALDDLGTATAAVSGALAALPLPELPARLDEQLQSALGQAAVAPTNVLPMTQRRSRWLPALGAVAAAAAVVVGGLVVTSGGGSGGSGTSADRASGPSYRVSDSGSDYTAKALAAALPALVNGTTATSLLSAPKATVPKAAVPTPGPAGERTTDDAFAPVAGAAPDPLAALRDTAGLARCLASLTDPSDNGLPLALDYASFQGTPALVVVLPSSKPDKVDVFVVPAGCAQADGRLLYFTRLPKP